MALPFLQSIGLSKKEADIYEILLATGEIAVGELIKKSELKRATVYKILSTLEKKGLVTKKDHNKKIHVSPSSPNSLLSIAEKEFDRLERAKMDLQKMLPDLTDQYVLSVERPIVTTFQGVEGLKRIYDDTLLVGKPIFAALTTAQVDPTLFRWVTKTYTKKRIEKKVSVKVIVSSGGWAQEYIKKNTKELRETRLVPNESFPFAHEMDIYGDKVAFIDFRKDGPLIGIIIHHPAIAATMQALWNLAWQGTSSFDVPTE